MVDSMVVIVCRSCLTLATSASTHILDGMFRPCALRIAAVLRLLLLLKPRLAIIEISSVRSLHLLIGFRVTPSRLLHWLGTIASPTTFTTTIVGRWSLSIVEVLMVLLFVVEAVVVIA